MSLFSLYSVSEPPEIPENGKTFLSASSGLPDTSKTFLFALSGVPDSLKTLLFPLSELPDSLKTFLFPLSGTSDGLPTVLFLLPTVFAEVPPTKLAYKLDNRAGTGDYLRIISFQF